MHPYLVEKLAEAHHDELLRGANPTRLPVRTRSRPQRERLATRLLDALFTIARSERCPTRCTSTT
jgi:hypothetical protein